MIDLVGFFPLGEKFRKMILEQFSTFRQTEQNGIALYKIPFLVPHILVFFWYRHFCTVSHFGKGNEDEIAKVGDPVGGFRASSIKNKEFGQSV